MGADMLQGEQVAVVNSKGYDFPYGRYWPGAVLIHWLAQPDVRAVLVTHGTDTLEETACFRSRRVSCANCTPLAEKPVV